MTLQHKDNEMTPEQRRALIQNKLDEESGAEQCWYWLSFADGNKPPGSQFLGVAVVRAPGFGTAVQLAHALGINPGGEVSSRAIPINTPPPDGLHGKLVTDKATIAALEQEWADSEKLQRLADAYGATLIKGK